MSHSLARFLRTFLQTNNLEKFTWHTGCVFERDWDKGASKISQTARIDQLVDGFNIFSTSKLPACPSVGLKATQEGEEVRTERYREAVGGLLWLTNTTRPDIPNVVREVARLAHNPSVNHWGAVPKIL